MTLARRFAAGKTQRRGALLGLLLLAGVAIAAPSGKTRHVFLITTDGLRPQEVFTGVDPALLNTEAGGFKDDRAIARARAAFWHETPEARRAALLPFFWSAVAQQGQVFGDAARGSVVRVTNGDVMRNIEGVLVHISEALSRASTPHPGAARHPSPEGEGLNEVEAQKLLGISLEGSVG